MSHEITSTDGLVLARTGAWHGLGQVLPQAPTVREAFRLAGLGWRVERSPIYIDRAAVIPSGSNPVDLDGPASADLYRSPDKVALVRSDTADVFEVVGKGYEVFQNDELADLVEGLSRAKATQLAETAGSLRGGRNVFALVPRGEYLADGAGGSDLVRNFLLFSNSHDGTGSLIILPTEVRVVCANTLAMATAGVRIRHTLNARDRVAEAVAAMNVLDKAAGERRTTVQRLASTPMTEEDRRIFFLKVYERAFGALRGTPTTATDRAAHERAQETIGSWLANLDSARTYQTGTVWHAFNAVTEWSDHARRVKGDSRDARVYSNLLGTSAGFKEEVFELATQAAG